MNRTSVPLITVGLTCFNAGDTIGRAVRGALAQTWPNVEIVVVDDCSTDKSCEVLTRVVEQQPRIRLIRHETNRGFPAALNTLVQNARGEFIAFFDDDDESVPDRLAAQYERVLRYERATGARLVLCYSSRNVVGIGQSDVDHVAHPIGHHSPEPHGSIVADYIFGVPPHNHFCWGTGIFGSCTMLARRSTFVEVGSFDVAFRRAAEMDFAVRAAQRGAHFISVERPLITQYKTSSSDKSLEINFQYWQQLSKKHKAYLLERRAYWASLAILRMRLHRTKGNTATTNAWAAVALLLLPLRLAYTRFVKKALRY